MTIGNSVGKTGMAWIAIAALLLLRQPRARVNSKVIPVDLGIHSRTHRRPGTKNKNGANASKKRKKEKTKTRTGTRSARAGAGKVERLQELYDDGREDLDEDRYDHAGSEIPGTGGDERSANGCGALLEGVRGEQIGQRDSALTTIADLKRRFPQSRWQKDAGALEIEVKQSTGQAVKPADQSDEELKMLAIQGLMNSGSENALPLLEKVINGSGCPRDFSQNLSGLR